VKSYTSISASIGTATHHAGAPPSRTLASPSRRCARFSCHELWRVSTALQGSQPLPWVSASNERVLKSYTSMSTGQLRQPPIGKGRTKQDARRKRETGTARPHELGLRWYFDPHARGWAVQLGTGANGSSTGRLILRKPRSVFSGVLPRGTVVDVTKRPWDASARLHAATCSFGQLTGRIEHLAGALCKSTTDTFDRISRGHGVEAHEHVNCSIYWGLLGDAARVAIAVLMPFHSTTTTDSVESIRSGLAESPSEVLNPPSASPKAAGSRV